MSVRTRCFGGSMTSHSVPQLLLEIIPQHRGDSSRYVTSQRDIHPRCGDLNENGSHRLIYLNPKSLESGIIWEKKKSESWQEMYHGGGGLGVDFEVSKAHARPKSLPLLLPTDQDVKLSATAPAQRLSTSCHDVNGLNLSVCKQLNVSVHKSCLGVVSLCRDTVTDTL
ncbi:rCG36869, partial [Rattus norvegicus]